ncbi:methylamine utilization protein [Pseudomonas sp. CFBP 13719]|uniref:methylamine utilization protein n=1 Tax=Pseudomonas sp. CFBP 13719 TaxID=2775303 RepID=UPI00177A7880|nr:methylamine utilization protein [Pseudomonas sp. CFBP 13719]MBD8685274.1 methylamine utilization protein [Pseudomonas sp. CFBP 13719]
MIRFGALLGSFVLSTWVSAASFEARITQADGKPLADAVLSLSGGPAAAGSRQATAIMDQRAQKYLPHVLAVATGTSVSFPNSDNIRHQVYSFSPAKRFELRLYEGTPSQPELFDKAGVVVLGCNIHDWMLGYIYVTDDPWFAVSDEQGRVRFDQLPAGRYQVSLWHPRSVDAQVQPGGEIDMTATAMTQNYTLKVEATADDAAQEPATGAFSDAFKKAAGEAAQ